MGGSQFSNLKFQNTWNLFLPPHLSPSHCCSLFSILNSKFYTNLESQLSTTVVSNMVVLLSVSPNSWRCGWPFSQTPYPPASLRPIERYLSAVVGDLFFLNFTTNFQILRYCVSIRMVLLPLLLEHFTCYSSRWLLRRRRGWRRGFGDLHSLQFMICIFTLLPVWCL